MGGPGREWGTMTAAKAEDRTQPPPGYLVRDQMPALARFPIWDLTRRAGGAALLGLGALQLRGWSRGHRERGRAFSAVALLLATGGVWMAAVSPFGPGELAPAMVFALALLGSIILGILAIRAGLVAEHRRWMRRAFALALGPLAVRAVHMLLAGELRTPEQAADIVRDGALASRRKRASRG